MSSWSNTSGFVALLISLLVMNSFILISAADSEAIISDDIEGQISQMVSEEDIPSLHVCVVSGGEVVWARGFGNQTSPDTLFLVGSIQKVFVAISILQLYEGGLIGLDDDINDYLSFNISNPLAPSTAITFRMLLSHRSGLRATLLSEFCYDWDGADYPEFSSTYYPSVIGIPLADYLSECFSSDGSLYSSAYWLYEPDTVYSYSNTGYKILMHLLEVISNQTISEYMQENIFGPLLMNNTGWNASEFVGHHATPHTRTSLNSTNRALPIWNGRYMLRSTVSDMGHLLISLMNDGLFGEYQLLDSETISLMFENTDPGSNSFYFGRELRYAGYGLGTEVRSHGIYGHGGSSVGFTAECYLNPATDLGYVRLSNVNTILDFNSDEWQDINTATDRIRDLVMTAIGMLPAYDLVIVFLVIMSSFSIVGIVTGVRHRMKRKSMRKPPSMN
jgi:CubicO group peptidase (beta-lactamase class C family)